MSETKVKLKDVRIAFCDALFEAKAFQGDPKSEPRHSATFLVPKNSPQAEAIEAAVQAAAAAKFGKKGENVVEAIRGVTNRFCIQDGDTTEYDGFAGHIAVRAKSKPRPTVIDRNRNQVTEADGLIYGGCYVNAIIDFFGYDSPTKGISAGLKGVQYNRKGDAFGGGAPAAVDDFDDLGDTGEDDLDDLE